MTDISSKYAFIDDDDVKEKSGGGVIEGYKDLQIERENREKHIKQLEYTEKKLREKLKNEDYIIENYKRELEYTEKQEQRLEAELLSNNQYINLKDKEVKSLQKEIKDNESDILDLNNQIEYMDEKKQELEYIITNKDKEILDLNCIIEGMDEKNKDLKKQNRELKDLINTRKGSFIEEMAEAEDRQIKDKKKIRDLERKLKDLEEWYEKKLKSLKEKRMYYLTEREELEEKYLYSDDESDDEEAVIHDEDTFENPDDYSKFIEMTMNGYSEDVAREEIKLYNEAKATGNYETYFANMED